MQTLKYICCLVFLLTGKLLFAQILCGCDARLLPASDCCGDLEILFDVNCDPSAIYDQIVIDPTLFGPNAGRVASVNITLPGFSNSIDPLTGIATINYTGNLTNLGPLGTIIPLGTVCFSDLVSSVVTSGITLTGPAGEQCDAIAELPLNCPTAQPWTKIYGDTLDNRPVKIKAFTDGVYVAGYQVDPTGTIFPTISKFSITSGALAWQQRLGFEGRITDLEYDVANDELILVGTEGPVVSGDGVPASTRSFVLKIDDFGNPTLRKFYDQNGREGFTRIIRHPNPANPAFPYYVLGRKNPNPTPSTTDIPVVYNINENLNVNWVREYQTAVEVEAYRGIIPIVADGDFFLVGNGSTANEGALFDIDGATGALQGAVYYPGVIDLYDGVDIQNGEIALAGTDFGTTEALVYIVDRANYSVITGFRFPEVDVFRELGRDGGNGDLYAVGEKTGPAPKYPVVHRLSYINGIGGYVLDKVFYKYLFDNETDFDEPHLHVSPAHDAIFYTDARTDNPAGFGNYDMLVGSFDLDLTNACVTDFPQMEQSYTVSDQALAVTAVIIPEPPSFFQYFTVDPGYVCNDFCTVPACTADFTWTADCCEVQFVGSATGTGPFTYEWDINCDNLPGTPPDLTGQNVAFTFPATGSYQVCLTITDATGCSAVSQQTVSVVDNPPVLTCPPSLTISTDPDECFATRTLVDPLATDDCTTMFVYGCTMSGATVGPAISPVQLNKGITTITCQTEDAKGQMDDCSYTITVVDTEFPTITCPDPIVTSVPACAGGQIVNFTPPVFEDNCPMASVVCSPASGSFFPCGTTQVTCMVTDMAGNQTTCTFPVTVNCDCAEVGNEMIACTAVDDQFSFSIDVNDLGGGSSCTVSVSTSQAGVTISNTSVTGPGPNYTVTGLIDVAAPPVPTTITILVTVNCVCPDGSTYDCTYPVVFATPCCKEVTVDPQEVCKTDGSVTIPLLGCNTLYDITQVRWYVADAPCPPASWGLPFLVTSSCAPLTLLPGLHNGDVCVYAEVFMGSAAGPCTMLTSNTATITLCEPITCSVPDQAYCYTGTPIVPAPLTVNLTPAVPNCTYTLQWLDPTGSPIPGATGPTYQPPALSFTGAPTDCSQSYTYSVIVSLPACGDVTCTSTIRLDNEAAPVGNLVLLPPDTDPICYGEDVVLEYTPECAGTPARWDWFLRPASVSTYTPLPTNGDRNPIYYSNRLYESTWFKVEKTNGVCPTDEIELLVNVLDPVAIVSFTADYDPICDQTGVEMSLDFVPTPAAAGCTYTVTWYRNGAVLNTSTHTTSPAVFNHAPPAGTPLGGNYYCTIESSCCPGLERSAVVTLDPPMEVYATGPCYRCNCDTIQLEGIVLHPLAGFTCTYQWYDGGTAIPGATGLTLSVDPQWIGPFTFEVTCTDGVTTCVKSDIYTLLQCGVCPSALNELVKLNARVFPNPTDGYIRVELEEFSTFTVLEIFDVNGRLLRQIPVTGPAREYRLDLTAFPAGIYTLRGITETGELLIQSVVKQ